MANVSVSYNDGDIFDFDENDVAFKVISGGVMIEDDEPTPVQKGDLNGDGKINRQDRVYIARALAGWDQYKMPDISVADVNKDGKVNRQDRVYIARSLAGWAGYETIG